MTAADIVLVWVLVISSMNSSKNEVEMLGPFADRSDCLRVQNSQPIREFRSQCVQVNMVIR